MTDPTVPVPADQEPWEANACFTIRAESEEKVSEIMDKLDTYAKRIGAGALFNDYAGPQKGGIHE